VFGNVAHRGERDVASHSDFKYNQIHERRRKGTKGKTQWNKEGGDEYMWNKLLLVELQRAYNALRDHVTAVERVGVSGGEAPLSQNVATDGIT